MKSFILLFSSITFACFLPVTTLLADNFISESAALQCIEINKNMDNTQQDILSSEAQKANLKSKINYLTKQIQKRRRLIEGLDQQHNQLNNDNYNQLIDQFDSLMTEREDTISLYNNVDTQHLKQYEIRIDLEKTYKNQCLNNIQISKGVFSKVCELEKVNWCKRFSF